MVGEVTAREAVVSESSASLGPSGVRFDEHPPLPVITPESEPFWTYTKEHAMRMQRCSSCGVFWFPPSIICPECWSAKWSWEPVTGTGMIFSFVTFRRLYHPAYQDMIPYVVADIQLLEGPRMLSRLVNVADLASLKVGQRVAVRYEDFAGDFVLPVFEVVGEG